MTSEDSLPAAPRGWTTVAWAADRHNSTEYVLGRASGASHVLLALQTTQVDGAFHWLLTLQAFTLEGASTSVILREDLQRTALESDEAFEMLRLAATQVDAMPESAWLSQPDVDMDAASSAPIALSARSTEQGQREFDLQLEEFKQLQAEGVERTRLQNTIIAGNAALVAAGVAVTTALPTLEDRITLLVALPILSVLAAALYLDQTEHIIAKDEYVDTVLRPRFEELTGNRVAALRQREWRRHVHRRYNFLFQVLATARLAAVLAPGLFTVIGLTAAWSGSASIRRSVAWPHYLLFAVDIIALIAVASTAAVLRRVHFVGPRWKEMSARRPMPGRLPE